MDYDLYDYLEEKADEYIPLAKLLKINDATTESIMKELEDFREKYNSLLLKYGIRSDNISALVDDLTERIAETPENRDLQYIYICTVTDMNILNDMTSDTAEEAYVRNYIEQRNRIQELSDYLERQIKCRNKMRSIVKNLKRSLSSAYGHNEEAEDIYILTIQFDFISGGTVYRDNINALINCIDNDENLKKIKPYIIFAIITRKHGMMQKRAGFIPNLGIVFQYQKYSIYGDNRKNFHSYSEYVALYVDLCRYYGDSPDVEIMLCDFCFANTSSLSEWFCIWCEHDVDIPISFRQKVDSLRSSSFPMLYTYEEYNNHPVEEIEEVEEATIEKMLEAAGLFTKI